MNTLHWQIQTSPPGAQPIIIAEYLLNVWAFHQAGATDAKKIHLTAVTGFRIGYVAVPHTDYRMAPIDRNAILWHKVTAVVEDGPGVITVHGNTKDIISIACIPQHDGFSHYPMTA